MLITLVKVRFLLHSQANLLLQQGAGSSNYSVPIDNFILSGDSRVGLRIAGEMDNAELFFDGGLKVLKPHKN